ncbi:FecR family protein [Chitinophaga sp. sic0106]|uniref:FecR family protein n=1 Tax=Chitinophaga sp. sic0106 TaxID=2854785 RepID=UPI001C4792E5|nr:FecR domain-containing protein [Chitinophaga sp. sic0106]MBV7530252.1 FecR domain-containing protein [Chitinophaga sp. sic0106]
MEQPSHKYPFDHIPEEQLEQWLDHLATTTPFPGEMPAGKAREQLRRQLLQQVKQNIGHAAPKVTRMYTRWAAAAAVTLLLGASTWLLLHQTPPPTKFVTLSTKNGERKVVTLPDNSTIYLGPDVTLAYAENFSRQREIKLLRGEVFFDVQQDNQHPFRVYVDSLQVDVLGTSFNIKAYARHQEMTIGVSTGKIRVSKAARVLATLTPSLQMQISRKNYHYITTALPGIDMEALRSNRISFENMPLTDVLTMLEAYYPVQFKLQNNPELRVSGSFNRQLSIQQVVSVLQQLTGKKVIFTQQQPGTYIVQSS